MAVVEIERISIVAAKYCCPIPYSFNIIAEPIDIWCRPIANDDQLLAIVFWLEYSFEHPPLLVLLVMKLNQCPDSVDVIRKFYSACISSVPALRSVRRSITLSD
jgi:hypothetical protein